MGHPTLRLMSGDAEKNLQVFRRRGRLEGFEGLVERESSGDKVADVDGLAGEGVDRFGERPAAAAEQGHFVDHQRGEVDRFGFSVSAFENDGAAWANEG